MAGAHRDRGEVMTSLLDAAERLLVAQGHAGLTTRRVAQEAGVNHGLVHYYFGSMDELLMQVLERFTGRLVVRQREMYGAEASFLDKWREAWRYHEDDLAAGYPKVWFELQAKAWSSPQARAELAVDLPPTDALVTLVMVLAQGTQLERLLGLSTGHEELLAWIDLWLEGVSKR